MTKAYDALLDLRGVTTLSELLAAMDADAYEESNGCYSEAMPTWGPTTPAVRLAINRSCADEDIVSWDTLAADPAQHRALYRGNHCGAATFYIGELPED